MHAAPDRNGAANGVACIEIVGFPQLLYVRSFGDPDTMFVPLLDSTREAFGLGKRLLAQGEDQANAISLCGMHLASSLLRDPSFSLGVRSLSPETSYTVSLETGTLHLLTHLYAVVNRRTSFFKVEVAGNVAEGPFVARDPVRGAVIMQIEEKRLRQSAFFSKVLADECVRAQINQERFGHLSGSADPEANIEVRMTVHAAGGSVPITVRRKESGAGWDVIDGRHGEQVGRASAEIEEYLNAVTGFIEELVNK
jgi:hypothetical protein